MWTISCDLLSLFATQFYLIKAFSGKLQENDLLLSSNMTELKHLQPHKRATRETMNNSSVLPGKRFKALSMDTGELRVLCSWICNFCQSPLNLKCHKLSGLPSLVKIQGNSNPVTMRQACTEKCRPDVNKKIHHCKTSILCSADINVMNRSYLD